MTDPRSIPILYIEDDQDLAALVRSRLSGMGYRVDIAHDGQQGFAMCMQGDYALMAVDQAIPGHNGLDVIRMLALENALPPTIMITGRGNEEIAVETMKLGADDYIVKDALGEWLHMLPRTIERTLRQRQLLQEKEDAENALRESERRRLEAEKLAATGRLAAEMAHEINNPLAGVKNAFMLIKDAVPDDHPDHEFVERIEKELDRIATIVRQTFKLYGSEKDTAAAVDIDATLRDVVFMLEPACRHNDVALETEPTDSGIVVVIPEGTLRQVLYNLLTNAINASPPGAAVEIGARTFNDHLLITVSDNGAGIPPSLRDKIFEPFFTTKSNNSGTGGLGLGLPISKSVVEAHGGSLDFESELGKGTTFRVLLPLQIERPELNGEPCFAASARGQL